MQTVQEKGFKNLDSIFEWEVETKFYKLNN